ncbi:hypothetical protein HPP92_001677 [Vanilla planifolia]|uniref:non-specific serine/threonine protein kinase n=1 Tax=Vanilla planifolia TaxID=51239 RepID=A0A835RRJ0_VANPL|nr:hypothetical protein HPP92_001677 [Vanilla planifolia]
MKKEMFKKNIISIPTKFLRAHDRGILKGCEERRRRRGEVIMLRKFSAILTFIVLVAATAASARSGSGFVFNGFNDAHLQLNGASEIQPNGLLRLTNFTQNIVGHAFYPIPFPFLNSSGKPLSFSTSFVLAILSQYKEVSSHGMAFAITASSKLSAVLPSQHLGLFNLTHNGDVRNHILAVELDTIQNTEFNDINDNHVGIDVNGLTSLASAPASFFIDSSGILFQNLSLISGDPFRVWAEYDAKNMELNVTLAPLFTPKPKLPLLSTKLDLSSVLLENMYVGFASSTGTPAGSHYILGWSFSAGGTAEELELSNLPPLPPREAKEGDGWKKMRLLIILIPTISIVITALICGGFAFLLKNKKKFAEVVEPWEAEYGTRRFSYKDLYGATKGFSEGNLLGQGGFGEVYKGTLPKFNLEIAVKRISHDSKQGMKEFVAEIASMGRLRHRNLVQLLGYSRRRNELLLVYDFMPNMSLDKYIFCRKEDSLDWSRRFKVIRGISAGLLYLHEEWEQVVLHRDIKASNVLLDADFNGKLGDFGLARLHDHGSNLQATKVVGTLGYLAPELSRTSKSTTSSDVFGFGAFLLELACGKRPIELKTTGVELVLVDWVAELMKKGQILEARDRRLGEDCVADEVELVLRLGLMCSHPEPAARPSMRKVVRYLDREAPLPDLSMEDLDAFQWSSRRNNLGIGGSISSDSGTVNILLSDNACLFSS